MRRSEVYDLAREVARFRNDPLGFVQYCYPWGQGELFGATGPDANQREFLESLGNEVRQRNFDGQRPVMPIRMAASSGHGTGKSVLGAWIINWIMSTRPWSIGTVTAGTATQLEERTWAGSAQDDEIVHHRRLVGSAERGDLYPEGTVPGQRESGELEGGGADLQEENAQSFAGQHAATSTSYYVFDEASVVPDSIYKVAYGGLTDGEPMMFAWGQPERRSGEFYQICFGDRADRWNGRRWDSRSSRFTNKELIAEWERDSS